MAANNLLKSKNNLMQQSVQAFWQSVNWENNPIPFSSLSLAMPVKDYFAIIPWSGVAIAQSGSNSGSMIGSKTSSQLNIDDKTETLDDFLDDISRFF